VRCGADAVRYGLQGFIIIIIAKPDQSNAIYGALLDPTKGKAQQALQNLAHCALCQRMRIW
jgi:hypothetical protein